MEACSHQGDFSFWSEQPRSLTLAFSVSTCSNRRAVEEKPFKIMNDLRPQKEGHKQLSKMTKKELLDEIKRLDEVIQITARRLDALRRKTEEP